MDTTTDKLITKHATACYEELLESVRKEGGRQWYFTVEAHMQQLMRERESMFLAEGLVKTATEILGHERKC